MRLENTPDGDWMVQGIVLGRTELKGPCVWYQWPRLAVDVPARVVDDRARMEAMGPLGSSRRDRVSIFAS